MAVRRSGLGATGPQWCSPARLWPDAAISGGGGSLRRAIEAVVRRSGHDAHGVVARSLARAFAHANGDARFRGTRTGAGRGSVLPPAAGRRRTFLAHPA